MDATVKTIMDRIYKDFNSLCEHECTVKVLAIVQDLNDPKHKASTLSIDYTPKREVEIES